MIGVLHVVQSGDRGGAQRHVRDLVLGLSGQTVAVVAGHGGWLMDELGRAGIATVLAPSLARTLDPLQVRRASAQVRQAARRLGATMVHAHGIFALLASADAPLPLIYTTHGVQWTDRAHPAWLRSLSWLVHRLLRSRVDALVAVSEQEAREAEAVGVPAHRIHHIPNGVEPPGAAPMEENPVCGMAARLVAGKGLEDLIAITADLSPVTMHLAGDGPLRVRLQAQAGRLGVADRVRFLGWLDDLGPFYRGLAVYATLSQKEGLPYTLLDAMAYGLPVVASDIPGHRELVVQGRTGFLVENRSAGTRRLAQLLADPVLRFQMGREAAAAVLERFPLQGMLRAHAALYAAMAETPPG